MSDDPNENHQLLQTLLDAGVDVKSLPPSVRGDLQADIAQWDKCLGTYGLTGIDEGEREKLAEKIAKHKLKQKLLKNVQEVPQIQTVEAEALVVHGGLKHDDRALRDQLNAKQVIAMRNLASRYAALGIGDSDKERSEMALRVAGSEGEAERKRLERALSPPKVSEAKNELRKRLVEVRALLEHFRNEGTPGPMLTAGKALLERIMEKFDADPSVSNGRCTVALKKGVGHDEDKGEGDDDWCVSSFQILADSWVDPFVEISLPEDAEYREPLRRALEECALGAQAVSAAPSSEPMIKRWAADTETPFLSGEIPSHVIHILGLNRAVWIFATVLERCVLEQRRLEEIAAWIGTCIDGTQAKPVGSDKPLKELEARLEAEAGALLAWREENRQAELEKLKERLAVDRMKLLELAGASGEKGIVVYQLREASAAHLKPAESAAVGQNVSSQSAQDEEEVKFAFLADELKVLGLEKAGIPEQFGPKLTKALVPVPQKILEIVRAEGSDHSNQSDAYARLEMESPGKSSGGFWPALIAEKDALFGKAAQPVDNLGEGGYKLPEDPALKGAFPRLGGLLKEAASAPMKLLGPLLAIFAPLMILGIPNPLKALFKSNDLELPPDVLWMYVLVAGILGASWIAFSAAWGKRSPRQNWLIPPVIAISVFMAALWSGLWVPAGMDKYVAPARVEALHDAGFHAIAYHPDLPVYACLEWRRQYVLFQQSPVPPAAAASAAAQPPSPFNFAPLAPLLNASLPRGFTNESAVKDLLASQPESFGDTETQAHRELKTAVNARITFLKGVTIKDLKNTIATTPPPGDVEARKTQLATLQLELANLEKWLYNVERFKQFYRDMLVLTADSKPLDEAAVITICDSAWRNGFHPMREAAAFVLADKLNSAGKWWQDDLNTTDRQGPEVVAFISEHNALLTRLAGTSRASRNALVTGKAASPPPKDPPLSTLLANYETADQFDGGTRLFLEKVILDHAEELRKLLESTRKEKSRIDSIRVANELEDLHKALSQGLAQDARPIWPAIQAQSSHRLLRNLKTNLTVAAVTANLGNNGAAFTAAVSADDLNEVGYLAGTLAQAAALNGNAGSDAFQVYLRAMKTLGVVSSGADAAGRILAQQAKADEKSSQAVASLDGNQSATQSGPSPTTPAVTNTAEFTQSNLARSSLWTSRSWHYRAFFAICAVLVGYFVAAAVASSDLLTSRRLVRLALCVLAVWVFMMLECTLGWILVAAGLAMLWRLSGTYKWIGLVAAVFGFAILPTGVQWQGLVPAYEAAAASNDGEHVKRRVINFLRGDQTIWNDDTPRFDASPLALLLAPSDRALDAKQKVEVLEREPHVAETGLRSVRPWGAVATCTALVAALMWFGWLAYRDLRNKHEIALNAARRQAEQKVLANAERLLDDSAKKEMAHDKNIVDAWIERLVRSLHMRLEDKDAAAQKIFEQQKSEAEARANRFKARLKLLDGLDKEAEKLRAASLRLRDATFQTI